ncbi:MAG: TolC family protein [Lentisphaeria bacterium]|nr:TolC family protein [Lentisphaeria bacterium]
MRKIWSVTAAFAGVLLLLSAAGCKSHQDYKDDRAESAVKHFQRAKYREMPGETLTLQKCIDIALKNSLQSRISELEIEVQQEMETSEALGMLPQFNINNNFTARSNTPASSSKKISANGRTYGASYSEDKVINYLNIDLLFSLLDFGLTYFNTRQQADRVVLYRQRSERVAQNIIFDVVKAYFKVVAAQRAQNMTAALIEECRSHNDTIAKLTKENKISPARAFSETRRFMDMEKRLTAYQRNYESACIELRTVMGYYPSPMITVDESVLDSVPENDFLPGIDLMEQIAVMKRPELFETDIQKHINILECRKTLVLMFPNVKIYADWSNSNNSFLYNKSWWELGLRAAYNLLKLPQNIARYRAYDAQVDAEEYRAYAQAVAVMAEVRIAHGNMIAAKNRYAKDSRIYNDYKDELDSILKTRAAAGSVGEIAVDYVRLETLEAQINRMISLGEYSVAYYRLLNIMGLRSLDPRSVDELKEELDFAKVRAAKVLQRDREEHTAQVARHEQRKEQAKSDKEKQDRDSARQKELERINAEIDARIQAEKQPAQPVKK